MHGPMPQPALLTTAYNSLLDLELAQPMTNPPRLPSHKIRVGDIVGLQEYKKDKPTSQSLLSGVVSKVTDSVVTVALSQDRDDDELPQELQDRCQMYVRGSILEHSNCRDINFAS